VFDKFELLGLLDAIENGLLVFCEFWDAHFTKRIQDSGSPAACPAHAADRPEGRGLRAGGGLPERSVERRIVRARS